VEHVDVIVVGAGLSGIGGACQIKMNCPDKSFVILEGRDAIGDGHRVIIADDLLATGGTARAVIDLVEQLGGVIVGLVFVVELEFLPGREKLTGYDVRSLIKYQS
jgi:adenine/guanine phosphoribosyltransferase-like PRPP-binding protein